MKNAFKFGLLILVLTAAGCATGGAPKEPVSYKLNASDAVLTSPNGNLQLETGGDAPNIGWWEKLDDVVSWEVTVEYSCDYTVTVNYSLADTWTGSVVEITVGDQAVQWKTKGTGEGSWSNYTNTEIGTVSLEAGTYPVVMKVIENCEGDNYGQTFVANVRKLTLTTVSD